MAEFCKACNFVLIHRSQYFTFSNQIQIDVDGTYVLFLIQCKTVDLFGALVKIRFFDGRSEVDKMTLKAFVDFKQRLAPNRCSIVNLGIFRLQWGMGSIGSFDDCPGCLIFKITLHGQTCSGLRDAMAGNIQSQ